MKIVNYLFVGLFVISAYLQLNDPDPALWIIIYLFGAGICFQAARNIYYKYISIIGIAFLLIYASILFFSDNGVLSWISEHKSENIAGEMKAASPWIENTREFFGLLIVIFLLSINLFRLQPSKHKKVLY